MKLGFVVEGQDILQGTASPKNPSSGNENARYAHPSAKRWICMVILYHNPLGLSRNFKKVSSLYKSIFQTPLCKTQNRHYFLNLLTSPPASQNGHAIKKCLHFFVKYFHTIHIKFTKLFTETRLNWKMRSNFDLFCICSFVSAGSVCRSLPKIQGKFCTISQNSIKPPVFSGGLENL